MSRSKLLHSKNKSTKVPNFVKIIKNNKKRLQIIKTMLK